MKQQINEIKRMQQLAGLIKESAEQDPMSRIIDDFTIAIDTAWEEITSYEKNAKVAAQYLKSAFSETIANLLQSGPSGMNEASLNDAKDLLGLIQDYISNDYTADQGYGEDVIENAVAKLEKIKAEIIAQKGEYYFKDVRDYAQLCTYNAEYAGGEETEEAGMRMQELADRLGFTVDELMDKSNY